MEYTISPSTREYISSNDISQEIMTSCLQRLLLGKINDAISEPEARFTELVTELIKSHAKQKTVEQISSELGLPGFLAENWNDILLRSEAPSSPFSSSIQFDRIRDISWATHHFVRSRYFAKVYKPVVEVSILLENGERIRMVLTREELSDLMYKIKSAINQGEKILSI